MSRQRIKPTLDRHAASEENGAAAAVTQVSAAVTGLHEQIEVGLVPACGIVLLHRACVLSTAGY